MKRMIWIIKSKLRLLLTMKRKSQTSIITREISWKGTR